MALGESIKKALPWIEPVLDYFDWKKRVVAIVAAIGVAGWSFVKGLPWPVIVTIAFAMLVMVAYALVFPAFLKVANIGYQPRPDANIWKHKKQYELYQAAALLANQIPTGAAGLMAPDTRAWYEQLRDAISDKEIQRITGPYDNQHTFNDRYVPYENTIITKAELKKFSDARDRAPEFLADT